MQGMSPRRKSWLAMLGFAAAVIGAGPLPVLAQGLVIFAAVISVGLFRLLQRCPACNASLATVDVHFGSWKLPIHTPLAPRVCENCGVTLDSRSD